MPIRTLEYVQKSFLEKSQERIKTKQNNNNNNNQINLNQHTRKKKQNSFTLLQRCEIHPQNQKTGEGGNVNTILYNFKSSLSLSTDRSSRFQQQQENKKGKEIKRQVSLPQLYSYIFIYIFFVYIDLCIYLHKKNTSFITGYWRITESSGQSVNFKNIHNKTKTKNINHIFSQFCMYHEYCIFLHVHVFFLFPLHKKHSSLLHEPSLPLNSL